MSNETIRAWDIAIRVFHWSLVICFTISYLTGEEESMVHIYTGYAVLGLVVFRIIWGFIGTQHARFVDFLYSPENVLKYLRSLTTRTPQHFNGHTPPGGWFIIALLVSLLITTLTGVKVYGLEGYGPLAGHPQDVAIIQTAHADDDSDSDEGESAEELWEEIHEFFANLCVFLVLVHIAGVLITSRLHNENLVKAMFTGNKNAILPERLATRE